MGPAVGQWAQNLVVRGGRQWERRGNVVSGVLFLMASQFIIGLGVHHGDLSYLIP